METENLHKDHRSRLREKVHKHGLDCLAEHEVLEFFLNYVIPRKDTNPLAHNLIDHFGSLAKVFDANFYDLIKINGVGPECAQFINALSQFVDVYLNSKLKDKVIKLNNIQDCVIYFRQAFTIKKNEMMVVVGLSKQNRVVKRYVCKGIDESEISFDLNQIMNHVFDEDVKRVVIFHTHPDGNPQPTKDDYEATQRLVFKFLSNGIDVLDHIILNENQYFSFTSQGALKKIKNQFYSQSSIDAIYNADCMNYLIFKDKK